MKTNRAIAAVLCAAMVSGVTGCGNLSNTKAKADIEELMENYVEALNDFDADGVLELTNWEDDDSEYVKVADMLNLSYFTETDGQGFAGCTAYIASTIVIDYDSDDIVVKDNSTSIKVEYELVDWETVYQSGDNEDYDDVLDALKSMKKTAKVSGKISFELEKNEWKISKITNLNKVMGFIYILPELTYFEPQPTDTEPTSEPTNETTTSGTDFPDSYGRAIDEFIRVLEENEEKLENYYMDYDREPCGIYDIDGDGIPELYFITEEENDLMYESTLYIYSYNEYAGEAVPVITVPMFDYMAQSYSRSALFVTDDELVVCRASGEEALYHFTADVYDLAFNEMWHFRRDIHYEYDPETDEEIYTYEFFEGDDPVEEVFYDSMIDYYVENAKIILSINYTPMSNENEYGLISAPEAKMLTYSGMKDYLSSLK